MASYPQQLRGRGMTSERDGVGTSSSGWPPLGPPMSGAQRDADIPLYQQPAIVVVASLLCCPVGLVLVWLTRWTVRTKVLLTAGLVGLMVLVSIAVALAPPAQDAVEVPSATIGNVGTTVVPSTTGQIVSTTSSTTSTTSAPVTTAAAPTEIAATCSSPIGGRVIVGSGNVLPAVDLRSVDLRISASEVEVTWRLEGNVSTGPSRGFDAMSWTVALGPVGSPLHLLIVDFTDGRVAGSVAKLTGGVRVTPVSAATADGRIVTLRVPRAALPDLAGGWVWTPESEASNVAGDLHEDDSCSGAGPLPARLP